MAHQKHKIFIIDDEQVISNVLSDELRGHGYLCSTALNGDDSLIELLTQDFDISLVDIKLTGMSGLELLRQIRSCYYNVAVIIMTVVDDPRIVVEAMKLGAADYIVKPFDLRTVKTSILSALSANTQLAQPRHDERPLRVAEVGKRKSCV